ncbi:TonB-dependent receptor domain-containing protein [Methylophaga sp. OBS1]|uniref:TonB-dependent receptor domain-containing protein n=1 Tax=Methylophaga sp. OBS1 TaxID=2991933 RepID=UPI0022520C71|nr:TonB-dependent receptor [Methylophaga sp. OBS1]MCX4191392.1 TonB-dependent receptor [Methylophaga sp. OBS1]MCX4191662.1 TonB-dependent receptor [Methylophaga sp. OBS1]
MKPVNPGAISPKKILHLSITLAILGATPLVDIQQTAFAADAPESTSTETTYDIPAGPLSTAISSYAAQNGVRLTFDPALADGKSTDGLQGQYKVTEGFEKLLQGSGLQVVDDQAGGYFLVPGQEGLPGLGEDRLILDTVKVRAKRFYEVGPLPGLGLTKEEIPGNVQSISAKEIRESHSISMTDLFNSKLQGVTVNDYQSNPFQMDLQYRGFTAGPQIGTPQGLSVFLDGIRVNEPFGDVVNWDMMPMNAIASVDVFPGSNPIFGLNTLGGSFALKTKDGFNHTGTDVQVLGGSFGRKQVQAEKGWNNGTVGLFGAGSFFDEEGWRDNSPSKVNQFFGKASYRGEKLDLHLSTLIVDTSLVGNGLIPTEEYAADRERVFTSPDVTKNRLQQFQLSGAYQVNDTFSITGQVYRRKSKRESQGADVYTDFEDQYVKRNLDEGEEFTCIFDSNNKYGLPDYAVFDLPNGDFFSILDPSSPYYEFTQKTDFEEAFATLDSSMINPDLPDYYVEMALDNFHKKKNHENSLFLNSVDEQGYQTLPPGERTSYSNSEFSYEFEPLYILSQYKNVDPLFSAYFGQTYFYYYTPDGVKHALVFKNPRNADTCIGDTLVTAEEDIYLEDENNRRQFVDGGDNALTAPGFVDGTPTAILTDNTINQLTDGASIQLNWNTDKHKFMIGASVDRPYAEYITTQQLGLLTADREFYFAPDEIRDQYIAADRPIANNNFDGEQLTKSIYFSETWSPVDTWHFNFSARYNDTHGENRIKSRTWGRGYVSSIARYEANPNAYDACAPGEDCPTGYVVPDELNFLNRGETEEFSYYSLNPSLGVAWQARDELNVYANFAQGVRVPSVIELGCALDKTPVSPNNMYKSLAEKRSCSLPSTLSGDPYLPQIKAETFEVGLRGYIDDFIEWNVTAYKTNIKDDIYLVSFFGGQDFFDSIGKTQRQGLELGISGQKNKWGFSINYSLTEATFQDNFTTGGHDNSSSYEGFSGNNNYSRVIDVEPGARMPGVPLHNLNATVTYDVTPKWQVGLTAIAHSESYVRGNENNKHRPGQVVYESVEVSGSMETAPRKASNNPGTVPGYMIFNLQSTYRFTDNFRVNLLVNNIFDKEYFTAGMLGRNPFSPATYGAVGPDGYNHNSLEWNSTNFVAPGAPRGAWLSMHWQF